MFIAAGFPGQGISKSDAYCSEHPLQVYEKGIKHLTSYHGEFRDLREAHILFARLIEKHPDSPFGYLGMSRLKTLEAYRYGRYYNIKKINDEALPMAMKAMRAGPTLPSVHTHYDQFESIFRINEQEQEHIRLLLSVFPEKPSTYYSLADYLSNQGDYDKALEYYKTALRFSTREDERLKCLLRIAEIYLKDISDPGQAVVYFEQALSIQENLSCVWESLGQAYFQLHQYDRCIFFLEKALGLFDTPGLRGRLDEALGMSLEAKGKWDEAIASLRNAWSVDHQNTSLLAQIGKLYYKKNDYHNALDHLMKAIDGGSTDPLAFYLAGRSAHLLGQKENAQRYYRRYLQLKGDGQEADWIRKNIPELSHR